MRKAGLKTSRAELLSFLAGGDVSWLEQLLDDGVVDVDEVASSLYHNDQEVPDRIVRILALAPLLLPRGIKPKALAGAAEFGSSMGERYEDYETIRAAFEATHPSASPRLW